MLHSTLTEHLKRYPHMQAADVYKLPYQAAMGNGHAVRDIDTARGWLERELSSLGEGPDDPLIDPLPPDGQLVRVHLRPYMAAGKDPEALLRAFVRTANEWHGSVERLKEYRTAAVEMIKAGLSEIRPDAVESFFATMEAQGFPAVHHSETYARLYRPAYRVVAREYLEEP